MITDLTTFRPHLSSLTHKGFYETVLMQVPMAGDSRNLNQKDNYFY